MSAWMISDAHADLIAAAYRIYVDPLADAELVGRAQLAENAKSLFALYKLRHGVAEAALEAALDYKRKPWFGRLDPRFVYKQVMCAEYQACEHKGWEASVANQRLQAIVAAIDESDRVMVDSDPWGVDDDYQWAVSAAA